MEQPLSELLMIGFQGPEPEPAFWEFMNSSPPGGILLFKHNIQSLEQVSELLGRIQAAVPGAAHLLVGVDQEGGRVARLTPEIGFSVPPPAAELAAGPEPGIAVERAAVETAVGLRKLGFNMNFAPVLDVVTDPGNRVIGNRSYGADPDLVERLGLKVIAGLQSNGIAATAKHFPGHGPTSVDSHLDLPVIAANREEMEQIHLRPFRAAVKAGVTVVMTAHAVYPAIDPDMPATLSHPVLKGILREQWGYDGVIVTDSLTMQAIARRWSVPEACVLALLAGVDLLMIPSSPTLHRGCLDAITRAVDSGRLPVERVEASLRRIRQLREAYPAGG